VHEDGHDEAGFEQHQDDDQAPAQQTLDVEVVDQIGQRAEHEEQQPDLQVQADRVLLGRSGSVHAAPHQR
jgi:hypothetical protein